MLILKQVGRRRKRKRRRKRRRFVVPVARCDLVAPGKNKK
jgi:hypothetical protein